MVSKKEIKAQIERDKNDNWWLNVFIIVMVVFWFPVGICALIAKILCSLYKNRNGKVYE